MKRQAPTAKMRRQQLEALIEQMIAMLDEMDGDENLEDGLDAEPEETDQNGDDTDYSTEDDLGVPRDIEYDGSGVGIAARLVAKHPAARKRAKAAAKAPAPPLVYDLRGSAR